MGFRTQRDVDRLTLPPGKSEHMVNDELCSAHYVRLQGSAKSWTARPQLLDGSRPKIKIGDVAAVSLLESRRQCAKIVASARDGIDPREQRAQRKRQSADTFGALVDLYLERYAKREQKPRTLVETTRALRVHLAPLHPRPLADITRRDVAARFMALVDTSGPIMANRTRAAVSHCFVWAMQQGLAESNPVIGTARPAPEVSRERVLSLEELRRVWLAAGDDDYGRIVRMLILTGARRDEIGGLAERELDRASAMWVLPAARSKNGREHETPLAPLALEIIGEPRTGKTHVFGRGRSGFSGWSQSKARLDQCISAAGVTMAPWVLHDVRRSLVTHTNEHGIAQPHIIEACINHLGGIGKASVAGVYNRATYRREKAAALSAWAEFVAELVGSGAHPGGKVVALARRRQ